jgi:HK97 family phage portal protein
MALIEFRSQDVVQQISDLPGFYELLQRAGSGAVVNRTTAMRLAAVYSCEKAISEDLAGLPINVKQKKSDGTVETVSDHPAQDRLKLSPNLEMRAFSWRRTRSAHVLLQGNSYSFIERSILNPVKFLWPLDPDEVRVERVKEKDGSRGRIRYRVNDVSHPKYYEPEDILHIKGFSWNGFIGDSMITNFARNQIGIGLSLDEFEAAFFKNGINPGGVFEHPNSLGENKKKFLDAVKERFGGSKKRGYPMVLEDGMKFTPYEVKIADQQFLELLKLNKVDICGMFGVPQSRISISDSNTNYNNTEAERQRYYISGLLPWAVQDEQEMSFKLLTEKERKAGMFIKYNFDGFLRGDSKSRAEVNQIYHRMGVPLNTLLTQDDRNPVEGGDVGLVQISMAPVKDLGDIQKAKFGPAQTPAPAGDPKEAKGRGLVMEIRSEDLSEDDQAISGLVSLEKIFRGKILRVAERVINIECDRLEDNVIYFYGVRSDNDFILWLDEFYGKFPQSLKDDFAPVLRQYADLIRHESAKVVGGDPALTSDMTKFISEYLDSYAIRHAGASLGQLKGLVAATEPEAMLDTLMNRVSEWRENRPAKIADDETVRMANAVAREKWRQLGVTKLVWVTQGSKACPFCKKLSGKTVGIRSAFLEEGEVLTGKDASGNFLRISGKKSHPPIHRGCVCGIRPVMETRSVFNLAAAGDFVRQRDILPAQLRPFITPYTAKEYEDKHIDVYLADSELSGFGLTEDKELVSVFSLPGAYQGRMAVEKAVEKGAKKLDCFDTKLVEFYNKFGFDEVSRLEWDDQYAPEGWDYDKFGKPDIVYMERKEKKSVDDYKKSKGWKPSGPGTKGNKGTKAFQDLADGFIETTFGKDELDSLKKID